MPEGLRIRKAEVGDVKDLAAIHLAAFPTFFLASLGPRFLGEMYAGFVTLPSGIALLAETSGGAPRGCVVGSTEPKTFFADLVRARWASLGLAAASAALRHPRSAVRLLRGLMYRGEAQGQEQGALLSSICVQPDGARSGIGSALIAAWWAEARDRGATHAYLTTDARDNEAVHDFYRRAGWDEGLTFRTREGRSLTVFTISAGPGSNGT